MEKKLKITPEKSKGQTFKAFEITVKELNLSERSALNDKVVDPDVKQNFSFCVDVIRENTNMSDEELNNYSLDEIVAISSGIIEDCNKKKLKK